MMSYVDFIYQLVVVHIAQTLTFLDLSFNKFRAIPPDIGELPNWSALYLHANNIEQVLFHTSYIHPHRFL
jgi:hypothetical protein